MSLSVVPTFTCDRCGKVADLPARPADETVTVTPPVNWTHIGGKETAESSPPTTTEGHLCDTCSADFSGFMVALGAGGTFKPPAT